MYYVLVFYISYIFQKSLCRNYSIVFKVIETEMILFSSGIAGVTHQYFYLIFFFILPEGKSLPRRFIVYQRVLSALARIENF